MNNCSFIGRLGHDVSIKYIPSDFEEGDRAIGKFSLAIDRGRDRGTDWIECTAFGKTAETINQYFHKGSRIGVVCHVTVRYGDPDENGRKSKYTDFIVDKFDFCDEKKKDDPSGPSGSEQAKPVSPNFDKYEDDFPF